MLFNSKIKTVFLRQICRKIKAGFDSLNLNLLQVARKTPNANKNAVYLFVNLITEVHNASNRKS